MPNLYNVYKRIFQEFMEYHRATVDMLNAAMQASSDEFYLFGAHIFSTFLIALGLEQWRIRGILDNSPTKEGRRLYGTNFVVMTPNILQGHKYVSVILRAGIYNKEIMEGILRINPTVKFV